LVLVFPLSLLVVLVGFGVARAGLHAAPVAGDDLAGILHRVAQGASGLAHDGVAIAVEHHHLVVAQKQIFAALVIEQNYVVGFLLIVIDRHPRAALVKSLNDFCGLRAVAAAAATAEAARGSATSGFHFPG